MADRASSYGHTLTAGSSSSRSCVPRSAATCGALHTLFAKGLGGVCEGGNWRDVGGVSHMSATAHTGCAVRRVLHPPARDEVQGIPERPHWRPGGSHAVQPIARGPAACSAYRRAFAQLPAEADGLDDGVGRTGTVQDPSLW